MSKKIIDSQFSIILLLNEFIKPNKYETLFLTNYYNSFLQIKNKNSTC